MSSKSKFSRGDTGLLHNSTIKAEHLDTVDQRDIVRKIGELSAPHLLKLDHCMKVALGIA
jgi:mRNA-degrading endonuclease toxin of MazEF toxin-antitoxin module